MPESLSFCIFTRSSLCFTFPDFSTSSLIRFISPLFSFIWPCVSPAFLLSRSSSSCDLESFDSTMASCSSFFFISRERTVAWSLFISSSSSLYLTAASRSFFSWSKCIFLSCRMILASFNFSWTLSSSFIALCFLSS